MEVNGSKVWHHISLHCGNTGIIVSLYEGDLGVSNIVEYDLFCFNGINKDRRLLLVSLKITLDSKRKWTIIGNISFEKTLAVVGLSFLMQTHVFKNYGNLSKVLLYFFYIFLHNRTVSQCVSLWIK